MTSSPGEMPARTIGEGNGHSRRTGQRGRLSRGENRAIKRAAIIGAAVRLFSTRPYDQVSIDDIAEAAGISRPTVYKYTPSKQALLDSMVDTVLDSLTVNLRELLDSDDPPAAKLRRMVEVHIDTAIEMRAFYVILFSEQSELSDVARKRFSAFSHTVATDFQGLLDECVAARPELARSLDTWLAANLILSMLTTLYRWYDPDGPTHPDQLRAQILLVLGALVPPAARPRRTRVR